MPFNIASGDNVQLSQYCQYGDQLGINVLWYEVLIDASVLLPAQQVADAVATATAPLYADLVGITAQYQGCKLAKPLLIPQPAPVYSSLPTIGTITGDPLPSQICGVVSWRTNLAGRSYRGRSYLPFPAEADNNVDEIPSTDYMTRLSTWASFTKSMNLVIDTHDVTMNLMVYSKTEGVFNYVTDYVGRRKWGTQRRRGQFGRGNVSPF